ncbi:DNA methyltransferase [Faecalispora jeddahensis]|uniref:DNA methyltransferase n=1 Tax=Faecalispora jeddahensis TaxID=1414721 RepID=UPI0028A69D6F|nr:DNA methyltransferase [Faecalispora jeddahensis]
MSYLDFLQSKIDIAPESGFTITPDDVNPILKPHQRDAVMWAVKGGRRALFEAFGLGKTMQELEYSRIVSERTGGQSLITMPLGVKQEFYRDALDKLKIPAPEYVRTMEEIRRSKNQILITNYERVRDGDIDPTYFKAAAGLDEASVLRSFGSKTYQVFLDKFKGVPFKLVATATPAPNKYKELIHYAGFLEVMDTGQALTRFFKRDSTKANNLSLYPGKEDDFWLWVSSWALYISKPSDLGYDDTGYDLPPLKVFYHELKAKSATEIDKNDQVRLFQDASVSLPAAHRIKRDSIAERVKEAERIINRSRFEHFILWHDLEDERREIKKVLPDAVEIYGSQDLDTRERNTIDFSEGKFRLLATKKELSGSGCNFQRHCHRAMFVGIDYEFNDFIQAIHRIYRFLQPKQVIIDIIYMDTEAEVLAALKKKWKQYDEMTAKMAAIVKKYGLSGTSIIEKLKRHIGVKRLEKQGAHYRAINNDCILEMERMQDNSVGLIHTSIPFGNHYEYTASYNDFGHNPDTERFFEQMDFLSPHLLRVLKPGRVFACHVKDRVLFGSATGTGMPTIEPFHALCIAHYMRHGFQYFGMITVVTDVVRENNQTYRLGYTEQCKDGSKMGVGCPEYILLFRKLPTNRTKAYADEPVQKSKDDYSLAEWQLDAHAFWPSSGDRFLTSQEISAMPISQVQRTFKKFAQCNVYDFHRHVEITKEIDAAGRLSKTFMTAPPASKSPEVWDDINRMRTLNTSQSQKRLQLHVCPLQIDIVERIINRYSNPGDTVLDPFGGLMTVPYMAVKMGRYGVGIELNTDYFRDGVNYLESIEAQISQPTLFDFVRSGNEQGQEGA